jgi:hypothetical protein
LFLISRYCLSVFVSACRYHPAVSTHEGLATASVPGGIGVNLGQDHGECAIRLVLIRSSSAEPWDTPANAGFDHAAITTRLGELRARGLECEFIDVEALSDEQRSDLYAQALTAVARAGNRYRIRQVFGSRRDGGGRHLGSGVPALLVFEDGRPTDIYPHQVGDGYETICAYLAVL